MWKKERDSWLVKALNNLWFVALRDSVKKALKQLWFCVCVCPSQPVDRSFARCVFVCVLSPCAAWSECENVRLTARNREVHQT